MLVQAAWAAVQVHGQLQARYRLVRRFGGDKNPGAKKKAIIAIAHTLLKIAYQVLKTGQPYTDLGADLYTRRESPEQQHAYLERRLQKLHPGCTVTITISPRRTTPTEAALTGAPLTRSRPAHFPEPPPIRQPGYPPDNPATAPALAAARVTVRCRALTRAASCQPQAAARPSRWARSLVLAVIAAARWNSARASSRLPSRSSRSPRTLGSR